MAICSERPQPSHLGPLLDKEVFTGRLLVHGDPGTTGGKPLVSDNKAAFLKRVADKEYLVHDLDAVKTEVHGDIVIT